MMLRKLPQSLVLTRYGRYLQVKALPVSSLLGEKRPDTNACTQITLLPGYESIEELKNASESVRKIFSLEFASKKVRDKCSLAKTMEEFMEKYGLEEGDASREMEVIVLTVKVKNLTKVLVNNVKDFRTRNRLVKMAQRRRKLLLKLKEIEPWKYFRLLTDLQLRPPVVYPKYMYKTRYGKPQTKKKK